MFCFSDPHFGQVQLREFHLARADFYSHERLQLFLKQIYALVDDIDHWGVRLVVVDQTYVRELFLLDVRIILQGVYLFF